MAERNVETQSLKDQTGLGRLSFITKIIIVILVILATNIITGYVTYSWQNERLKKEKTNSDKKITDLQKQVDDLKSMQTLKTPISPRILRIHEFGIQITLPASIADAYYVVGGRGQHTYANFSTRNLQATGISDCEASSAHGPLGSITVTTSPPLPNPTAENSPGVFVKEIEGKYLYYVSPQSSCASDGKAEIAAIAAFKQAIQSATLIKNDHI